MCSMKFLYLDLRFFVLTVLLRDSLCETNTAAPTEKLLETYKSNFNTAAALAKSEKNTTKAVTDEFLVNVVKKMASYRLEMVVHRNYSLGYESNDKWTHCVNAKQEQIKHIDDQYLEAETECVNNIQGEIAHKEQALKQIIKEIHSWKRGYKYLQKLCLDNYAQTKENIGECIVKYMQEDDYNGTIQRLLELFQESQKELETQAEESVANLDDCLRNKFSNYLSGLRNVREQLNRCYERKHDVVDSKPKTNGGCKNLLKLNCKGT